MTINNFIKKYETHNPEGMFFSEFWLKFFGEDIKRMTVSNNPIDFMGIKCYELVSVDKNNPYKDKTSKYYFDSKSYEYIGFCNMKEKRKFF